MKEGSEKTGERARGDCWRPAMSPPRLCLLCLWNVEELREPPDSAALLSRLRLFLGECKRVGEGGEGRGGGLGLDLCPKPLLRVSCLQDPQIDGVMEG